MLNILALVVLGTIMLATVGLFQGNEEQLVLFTVGPLVLVLVVLGAPVLVQRARGLDSPWARRAIALARAGLVQVRRGLSIFRSPRLAARAVVAQLGAWAVQWMACYVLLVALGLNGEAGIGAAAAVLFAVNVSAVLPALPSNLGVFQAACVAVLAVYGVGQTDALAYGIVLQALEIATALALGMPALLREGLSWRDMRVRALNAAPVELRGGSGRPAETRA
jgi:phosphatidylinositol alpha-mannosyltransferase